MDFSFYFTAIIIIKFSGLSLSLTVQDNPGCVHIKKACVCVLEVCVLLTFCVAAGLCESMAVCQHS